MSPVSNGELKPIALSVDIHLVFKIASTWLVFQSILTMEVMCAMNFLYLLRQ